MRKVKSVDVVRAWMCRRPARAGTFASDGVRLYSRGEVLAEHVADLDGCRDVVYCVKGREHAQRVCVVKLALGLESYKEKFSIGSKVQIVDALRLQEFQRTWKYHNRLRPEQLCHAGRLTEIAKVGFYHGGDVLYELCGVPGIWHERCLEPATGEKSPQ